MLLHLGFPFICRPLGRSALYFLFTLFYHIISLLLSPSPCGPILATAASSKPLRARRYSRTVRCNSLDPAARGKRMMPPLPVNHGQRLCPRRLAQPRPFPPGFYAARARRAWARAFPSPPGRRARTARTKQGRGPSAPAPALVLPARRAGKTPPPPAPSFLPPPPRRIACPPFCGRLSPACQPAGKRRLPPARPPGAQYVSNPASEASALFPSGNTARPQVDPGFCNKQKPRGRKADLAATGVHMIQGALFRLL